VTNTLRLLTLTLLLASPSLVNATTVIFTASPVVSQNGTLNGFATAKVDGQAGHQLICDDKGHTTSIPTDPLHPLQYHVAFLDDVDPLQGVRFTSGTQEDIKDRYRAAAILISGLMAAGSAPPKASANLVTDYQYAIWSLFSSNPDAVTFRDSQDKLRTDALALVNNPNATIQAGLETNIYRYLRIYTPDLAYCTNQEFLELVTPEPGYAAMLLVAGAIGWRVRRRRRA
jgi:hypothetical protein